MRVSALERVMLNERPHKRAAPDGSFATPLFLEQAVEAKDGPFLASNGRGGFLSVRRSSIGGHVRYAYGPCDIEDEDEWLESLCTTLRGEGWRNCYSEIGEAVDSMRSQGLTPLHVVVPFSLLASVCGSEFSEDDADKLMLVRGYVTEASGLKVLVSGASSIIVAAAPSQVGLYSRIGGHLALLLCRADRSLAVVGA